MAILMPRSAGSSSCGVVRTRGERFVERFLDQVGDAVAVGGGDHVRVAHAELIEVGDDGAVLHALALVHDQHDLAARLAQEVGDGLVVRRHALAAVDDEDDDVRFGHGLLGLQGHLVHDAFLGDRLETAGVDDQEWAFADAAFAVVTIARQARQVRHQRIARAGETIE